MPKAGVAAAVAAGAIGAVLFDLDGTLIDSAPDLAGAGNDMRMARGLGPLPLAHYRPMVGSGARGIVDRAFDVGPQDAAFGALRDEFLRRYALRMTLETQVFADIHPVLDALDGWGLRWGIVTNKATRLSEPLARALNLVPRTTVLVCGDTTAHAKPHPAPLLEAARRIGVAPQHCWYVGDDLRDIQAGHAAAMTTVAAGWGYLGVGDPIGAWGAHHLAQTPADLLTLLQMA